MVGEDKEVCVMVMAPERPPQMGQRDAARRRRALAIGVVLSLVLGALVFVAVVADDATDEPPATVGAGVVGNGSIVTSERGVTAFDAVVLEGQGELRIVAADVPALRIRTDENILRLVTTDVRDSTLHVGALSDVGELDPTAGIVIDIAVPHLTRVAILGAGSATLTDMSVEHLDVSLVGTGSIHILGLDARLLTVDGAGVGTIEVNGIADTQQVTVTGVVDYRAADLRSEEATVGTSAASSAIVWVTEDIDVSPTNSGTVSYYAPPRVQPEESDLGVVLRLGSR